jgi:hypothetical protein
MAQYPNLYPSLTGVGRSKPQGGTVGNFQEREDVADIIGLSDDEFDAWYAARFMAVKSLKEQWELFASIPNLSYNKPMNHDSKTVVREVIDSIVNAESDLQKILDIREGNRYETDLNDS